MIHPAPAAEPAWLALERDAAVELTSEDPAHPIEAALLPGDARGWRASTEGEQRIVLRFAVPRPVGLIRLAIEERDRERTQEFCIRAAVTADGHRREIVRQQFNFSPAGATREEENLRVDLPAVAVLELSIVPDLRGGDARASLQELRLAAS